MSAQAMIRTGLLSVVAIALAVWAMKEFGPAKASATNAISPPSASNSTFPDGVSVINFHGEKRCRTCIGIGNLARKTVEEEFGEEEKSGRVHWQVINYSEAANSHYVTDYQLVSSTVVVTLWKDGKEREWHRLDGVWDQFGDDAAFRAYVAQGVHDLLAKSVK